MKLSEGIEPTLVDKIVHADGFDGGQLTADGIVIAINDDERRVTSMLFSCVSLRSDLNE
jgi:hypothetical protein